MQALQPWGSAKDLIPDATRLRSAPRTGLSGPSPQRRFGLSGLGSAHGVPGSPSRILSFFPIAASFTNPACHFFRVGMCEQGFKKKKRHIEPENKEDSLAETEGAKGT